ncbi:Gfo/Idh/MocA family protein [Bacillus sp. FJAT-28004]|uniref:Gfo/Idh/MocA family protein n=1 Tax=Bacillus sp. FJAT-28004 TaxID=1679165 RepID=UPI0006B5109E|nr:Gfo/Idh/MocA family oxidoreductase [Bacillus sp. FJAT-28004]
MTGRIKLGVIGLGEIAQIAHLPILYSLRNQFEITAICDVSKQLVDAIAQQYNVSKGYVNAMELIADSELEAVFILNSDEYHADNVIAALQSGLHVFVEKPMCLNMADAERIAAAKQQAGKEVMVGYMRRYAPAFRQALEEVKSMKHINYARFRDIIGYNHFFIGQTQNVFKFSDIPAELAADKAERGKEQVRAAIGDLADRHANTYRWMAGLCSHDFSAMREMLGMPNRVVAATSWSDRNFMNVLFEYDGFHVMYEVGFDHQIRFDASIEVFGDKKTVHVEYDSGYIRQLPTILKIEQSEGDSYQETVVRPTYTDPYTIEIKHFYGVVREGVPLNTTVEDAIEDLKLFQMIVQAIEDQNNSFINESKTS